MAAAGTQISSLHLAVAAGGGVLLYAALRGVSPVQALRDITSGQPPAVSTEGKTVTGTAAGAVAGGLIGDAVDNLDWRYVPGGYGTTPWKGVYGRAKVPVALQRPVTFVAALQTHATEKYSQTSRWKRGYSDCSSFTGKGLLDVGIEPPGNSITTDYLSSGQWVKVTSPRMGDVAVNNRHMAVFLDGSNGIGQQNSRTNVRRDTMDNLMANSGSWEIRRYRGWA